MENTNNEIKLTFNNRVFYLVPIPSDAYDISLTKFKEHAVIDYKQPFDCPLGYLSCSKNIGGFNRILKNGDIISTISNISDEWCDSLELPQCGRYGYRNYERSEYSGGSSPFDVWASYHLKTAKDCFISLLKSEKINLNKEYLIIKIK